jgi:hypothetical protein
LVALRWWLYVGDGEALEIAHRTRNNTNPNAP